MFVPSLGTTDAMLWVDALTNFTQQALQDSQKAISALNAKQAQIKKLVLQNRLAVDILRAAQGGTCAIIHTQFCTYIPDMSTNVTRFTKHMNKMIGPMDTPEASIASLWEMLTCYPWWKTILITIILIFLFLLFAPCVCNCVTGFVSSRMKAFNGCPSSYKCHSLLRRLLGAPGSETFSMRVRRTCCLNNLGTMPLNSRK